MLVPLVTSRGGTRIILGSCIDHIHHTGFNVDQSPVLREHVQNWPLDAFGSLGVAGYLWNPSILPAQVGHGLRSGGLQHAAVGKEKGLLVFGEPRGYVMFGFGGMRGSA